MSLFDLDRHNFVEASAGTGKTYNIEQIVLRLLTEKKVSLDKILVVTFTEKATGELKNRLRLCLEKGLTKNNEHEAILRTNLEAFDQAPIFTIHGFCQRVLSEFPLEQGQEFNLTLASAQELWRPALREIQRKWPAKFGKDFAATLHKAGYHGKNATDWEDKLFRAAGMYRPDWKHQLRPDAEPENEAHYREWLIAETLRVVLEASRLSQERQGIYTFDDQIIRVAKAVRKGKEHSATLLKRLRDRYHYAIVDEFQDTDCLQWDIFREIFVEGEERRLIVVGDPKQAIFGFRGADLPTYLLAKKQMLEKFSARQATLCENWRSHPDMLIGLNKLFQASDWFAGQGGEAGFGYDEVHPCPPGKERYTLEETPATAAIKLVDLREVSKRAKAGRYKYARFIAEEIERLLANADRFRIIAKRSDDEATKAESTCLQPSDIAILVAKRAEAVPILQELRDRHIPYTVYKQQGLWQELEATQVLYVLEALADPEDRRLFQRVLLTDFFRLDAVDFVANDIPEDHSARRVFGDWQQHASTRAWSKLFASMLENSAILNLEDDDPDRWLANLRHIFGVLEFAGYRDGLDIHGMVRSLRRLQASLDAEEGGYQPIETSEAKVKIMTIHASKGLEFPVVFFAAGFTTGNPDPIAQYVHGEHRVVDLAASEEAKALAEEEQKSATCRLYYVALTRAQFKLYLPLLNEKPDGRSKPGPAFKLLTPAIAASGLTELAKQKSPVVEIVPYFIAESSKPMKPTPVGSQETKAAPAALFPQFEETVSKRRIFVSSFSSLKRQADLKKQQQITSDVSFGEEAQKPIDEDQPVLAAFDSLRGAEFGDLVHRVLEQLDWSAVKNAESKEDCWREGTAARTLLDAEVKRTLPSLVAREPLASLEKACRERVGELVWLALKTPLSPLGGPLCDIPASDCLREIEFLFPTGIGQAGEQFLTGFIDIVFRKAGRYYLLDWKTNVLNSYDADALAESMAKSDYTRQYRLYAHALKRWLGKAGNDVSFEAQLGGVFYLYLRGLNGIDDSAGVFFAKPGVSELDLNAILEPAAS